MSNWVTLIYYKRKLRLNPKRQLTRLHHPCKLESIIVHTLQMTMSPSINYAEQVLREEAERLAKLKEEASMTTTIKQAKKEEEAVDKLKASIAKVNLKDEEDFPTLGKAKGGII